MFSVCMMEVGNYDSSYELHYVFVSNVVNVAFALPVCRCMSTCLAEDTSVLLELFGSGGSRSLSHSTITVK